MHSITQRRDPIVYCLEWLNNYKKEKPNQLMGYNLWKDDTCKGGEISHNRRSFIRANMVYIGRQKSSLGCCCAFLSCELVGPRSGLLFLAIVTHLWVSLWIPWFSAFESVVEIWGKYPTISSIGHYIQDVREQELSVTAWRSFQQLCFMRKFSLPRPFQGKGDE